MAVSYAGIVIAFLVTVTQTKILTPELIGLYSLIISFISIAHFFVLSGTPNIILKFYHHVNKSDSDKTGFLLAYTVIPVFLFMLISIVIFILKDTIVAAYDSALFETHFNIIFYLLFTYSFIQLFVMISRSMFKTVFPNFLEASLLKAMNLLALLGIAFVGYRFADYLTIYVAINVAILACLVFYIVKNIKVSRPSFSFFTKDIVKKQAQYGLVMCFAAFLGGTIYQIDKLMIGYFASLEGLGIYTVCIAMGGLLKIVGKSLSLIAHPQIGKAWAEKDMDKIHFIYKDTAKFQIYLGMFAFVFVLVFSKDILSLFNPIYAAGYMVLILITFGELINLGTGMCGGILSLSKYYRFDLYILLVLLVLNIVLNVILIPLYGINGAAIATAVSLAAYNLIKVLFVYFAFKMHPFSTVYLKSLAGAVITVFAIVGVKMAIGNLSFVLLLAVAVASFVFYNLLCIYFLKVDRSLVNNYLNLKMVLKRG